MGCSSSSSSSSSSSGSGGGSSSRFTDSSAAMAICTCLLVKTHENSMIKVSCKAVIKCERHQWLKLELKYQGRHPAYH
jgi:hypothetical protein